MDPKERTQTLVVSSNEMRMDVNWMNMSRSIIKTTNQPRYGKPLRTNYSTVKMFFRQVLRNTVAMLSKNITKCA